MIDIRTDIRRHLDILGIGNKVQCLMEGILKDIQVLVCERLKGAATGAQVKEIEEAIKPMNEPLPSRPKRPCSKALWSLLLPKLKLEVRLTPSPNPPILLPLDSSFRSTPDSSSQSGTLNLRPTLRSVVQFYDILHRLHLGVLWRPHPRLGKSELKE